MPVIGCACAALVLPARSSAVRSSSSLWMSNSGSSIVFVPRGPSASSEAVASSGASAIRAASSRVAPSAFPASSVSDSAAPTPFPLFPPTTRAVAGSPLSGTAVPGVSDVSRPRVLSFAGRVACSSTPVGADSGRGAEEAALSRSVVELAGRLCVPLPPVPAPPASPPPVPERASAVGSVRSSLGAPPAGITTGWSPTLPPFPPP